MDYIITFLQGLISFVSPCMLPMLPVYFSQFAKGTNEKYSSILTAGLFVAGFTTVYIVFGLFAGTLGFLISRYHTTVNVICGFIIILLGLGYLGIVRIPFFKLPEKKIKTKGAFSAFIFGVIFSVSHMPCMGAFLGSAVVIATKSGEALKGFMLLLSYSLGMGLPFLASALLFDKLSGLFKSIKEHYKVINIVCGIFLIILGVMIMSGMFCDIVHVYDKRHIH